MERPLLQRRQPVLIKLDDDDTEKLEALYAAAAKTGWPRAWAVKAAVIYSAEVPECIKLLQAGQLPKAWRLLKKQPLVDLSWVFDNFPGIRADGW